MSWGGPIFIVTIIALSMGGWIINTWIRAKHGYPLDDGQGNPVPRQDDGEKQRLRDENARLSDRLDTYEDRLIVLEKIITDKGYDVAHQIETLRDNAPRLTNKNQAG